MLDGCTNVYTRIIYIEGLPLYLGDDTSSTDHGPPRRESSTHDGTLILHACSGGTVGYSVSCLLSSGRKPQSGSLCNVVQLRERSKSRSGRARAAQRIVSSTDERPWAAAPHFCIGLAAPRVCLSPWRSFEPRLGSRKHVPLVCERRGRPSPRAARLRTFLSGSEGRAPRRRRRREARARRASRRGGGRRGSRTRRNGALGSGAAEGQGERFRTLRATRIE